MTLKAEKIAGIIQKEISEIIQFSLKDPKIGFITITDVMIYPLRRFMFLSWGRSQERKPV